MDAHFLRVSDEELFLLMSLGDKFSQDILINRYLHLGRQIAGVFIRQKGLRNVTDQDFIEVIYDSVFKAFRYYQLGGICFYAYCKEILNQNLYRAITDQADENVEHLERINLDDKYRMDAETINHEIFYDTSVLSSSEQYDVDEFLLNLSSSNSLEFRRVAKIYVMHEMGYSIGEIARHVDASEYAVRNVILNPKKAFDNCKTNLKLK